MKLVKVGDLNDIGPYGQNYLVLTYSKPYQKFEIVESPIRLKLDTDIITLIGNRDGQIVYDFLYSTQRKFKLEFLLEYVNRMRFFRESEFVKDFLRLPRE